MESLTVEFADRRAPILYEESAPIARRRILAEAREVAKWILPNYPSPLLEGGSTVDSEELHTFDAPFLLAIANGNAPEVEALIMAGSDPNSKSRWGRPILEFAISRSNSSVVEALVRGGQTNF